MPSSMRFPLAIPLLIIQTVFAFSSHRVSAEWHSDTQAIMGTEITATVWHKEEQKAKQALRMVMEEMHRIDRLLSPYKKKSELYRVNESAAKSPQKISKEFYMLIDKSLYFSRVSEGAFDITFASLGRYYDYRKKQKPTQEQSKRLLPLIDFRMVKLDKKTYTVSFDHPDTRIDLGGIAKGYAVENAAKKIRQLGIEHASISAGGDSQIIGDRIGRPWIIGIKNPRARNKEDRPAILLPLEDVAVSTSGDYERFFIDEESGERVHHIINPKSGKSVKGISSVTIIGPKGRDTDPLSTTVFVLGVEKGLALVNQLPGFDCVIIDTAGNVHYSDELMPPDAAREMAQKMK